MLQHILRHSHRREHPRKCRKTPRAATPGSPDVIPPLTRPFHASTPPTAALRVRAAPSQPQNGAQTSPMLRVLLSLTARGRSPAESASRGCRQPAHVLLDQEEEKEEEDRCWTIIISDLSSLSRSFESRVETTSVDRCLFPLLHAVSTYVKTAPINKEDKSEARLRTLQDIEDVLDISDSRMLSSGRGRQLVTPQPS